VPKKEKDFEVDYEESTFGTPKSSKDLMEIGNTKKVKPAS